MDDLDFAIFRFMSPHGEGRFWGTRRVIDPRITPRELAQQVGLSQNGVRARLRGLTEAGYLRGSEVCPNPSIFGLRLESVEIPVADATEARQTTQDLALVEGVTFVRDLLDETDRKLRVFYASDGSASSSRAVALLRRFAPNHRVRDAEPYWVPPADLELSTLDWRVLDALCRAPEATLGAIADSVGVTLKTTARRYHRLLDSRACWWTHSQACEEFPLALVRATVDSPSVRDEVATELARMVPGWMPVAADGYGADPAVPSRQAMGLAFLPGPSQLQRLVDRIAAMKHVISTGRTFALGSASNAQWAWPRIGRKIRGE